MVYLLHFERPYRHARHYLGYTGDEGGSLDRRLGEHDEGHGSPLVRAALDAGIDYRVALLIPGADRTLERRLHNRKDTPRWCPVCKEARGEGERG